MDKSGFVIHHDQAANPVYRNDSTHRRCEAFWRAVRNYHVFTLGWSDIAYSFGICRCGIRFEGLGWNRNQFAGGADQIADELGYRDSEWYSVLCFLGGNEQPTPEMIRGVRDLIAEGRATGRCGNRVIPHSRFRLKLCPGPELTALAQRWDNADLDAQDEEEDDMTPDDIKFGRLTDGSTINDRLLWTNAQVDAIRQELAGLRAGGGTVDLDALAEAVADKLAQRLQS